MIKQIDGSVRQTLEYTDRHNFKISDEKAFSVYFAFFYFEMLRREGKNPIFEFERKVFKEADFPHFFGGNERLDILLHLDDKKFGFELKYPKESAQHATKIRAEIYQAIGRLVHLTNKGFLNKGFLICATNVGAIYSGRPSNEYPTYNGYVIPEKSYILPSKESDEVLPSSSYGKIWNCMIHNTIKFEWCRIGEMPYRYLSPIEI